MDKISVGKKYKFKKDWSWSFDPIFHSAKKRDIVVFLGKSLGIGHFRNLTNQTFIGMSRKDIFKFLEEVD